MFELNIAVTCKNPYGERYFSAINIDRNMEEFDSFAPIDFCDDALGRMFAGDAAMNVPERTYKRKIDAERLAHQIAEHIVNAMAASDMKNGYKISEDQT